MEHTSMGNEHDEQFELPPERPMLSLDLAGEQGNVFAVIGHAREVLQVVSPEEQETFRQEITAATAFGAGKKYDDILAIVDTHVELVDVSETHPIYGRPEHVAQATERYQQRVIAAIDHLNEQIMTLSETVPCGIDGLYPEFDDPDYSPARYMDVLNAEIGSTEGAIEHAHGEQWEAFETYRTMLRECRSALRQAGVL